MAGKAVVEIVMLDQKAQNTLGGLNEKLTFLRNKLEDVKIGSQAFKDLQTQIQKTSSEVKTLEKQMEGLEPQQQAEAFLKLGEAIMGGFVASTGALAMFGVENEKIAEIQTRVQGAIAVAMGVRMMAEGVLYATTAKRVFIEKASIVQTKLNTAVTYLAAAAQKVLSKALGITTKGLKTLKVAVMATGIGALVVGVGALVSKLSGSGGANDGLSAFEKRMNAVNKELEEANRLLGREREKMLRDIGEVEENHHQTRLRETREQIEDKKALIETLKQEKGEVQEYIDKYNMLETMFGKKGQEVASQYWDELHQGGLVSIDSASSYAGAIEDLQEEIKELGHITVDAEQDSILLNRALDNTKNTINSVIEKTKERIKAYEEERKKLKEQRKQDAEDRLALSQEVLLLKIEDENERARKELEIQKQNDIAALKGVTNYNEQKKLIIEKYALLEQERVNALNEQNESEEIMSLEDLLLRKAELEQEYYDSKLSEEQILLNAVEDKYFTELELAMQNNLDTVELEKAKQAEIDKIKADARELEKQENEILLDSLLNARLAFTQAIGSSISEISGLMGEGTKAAKAAALAEIAINTGAGFMSGLRIAQKSADATGPGAMLAFPIFYATQIAAVLGAVKKAKAALGGGGPSESAPPVASVSAPTKSGNFTLSTQQSNRSSSSMIKTFVVADEMSQEQAQLADIRRRSTI